MASAAPRAVLIVEDERSVARALERSLGALGYGGIAVAASAEEAMARATERRPDVALIDIRIKGRLDGIQAAQLLQERFGVPVVYLTGHSDDATLERALRTHPRGYLIKPVDLAQLRSAIEIALSDPAVPLPRPPAAPAPRATATAEGREGRAPGARAVRRQLERILGSPDFDAPRRSRDFLRFVVEETLGGRAEAITQGAIALAVFGRRGDFDPMVDPIVRIQAGRLRHSLERYALLSGKDDPVRIELPRGTYVPVFSAGPAPAPAAEEAPRGPAAGGERGDGWPTVVLTGFEVSGAGAQGVADDVTDELALELGRYRAVRVRQQRDRETAGAAGARFALGGRVRVDGKDVRVTARLVDHANGEQVWGDEYHTAPESGRWSGPPEDVARVIAARVGAEEGVVAQLLAAQRRRRAPEEGRTPYDAILLSYDFFLARNPETLAPAVQALRRVVDAEPECGLAWTRLARLLLVHYAFEITASPPPIDEAVTCAQHAVRVDPASRSARGILASALLVKGELAAGRDALDQALQSSPGSLVYLEIIGYLLTLLGDWERGQAISQTALQRNPHCLPHVRLGMWLDALRRGDVEQAYQSALEYRDPTFFWRGVMRATCLGLLGRVPEARSEVAEVVAGKPDFARRGRTLIGYYVKFPEAMDPIVDGLARAGLNLA